MKINIALTRVNGTTNEIQEPSRLRLGAGGLLQMAAFRISPSFRNQMACKDRTCRQPFEVEHYQSFFGFWLIRHPCSPARKSGSGSENLRRKKGKKEQT